MNEKLTIWQSLNKGAYLEIKKSESPDAFILIRLDRMELIVPEEFEVFRIFPTKGYLSIEFKVLKNE